MISRTRRATILACLLAMPLHASWLSELHKLADLPPELATDVDVIRMPRVYTMWNPLNFPPYRVAKYRYGITHQELRTVPTGLIGSVILQSDEIVERSRRHDRVVLHLGGREALRGDCDFETAFDDVRIEQRETITCTLTTPSGDGAWTLDFLARGEPPAEEFTDSSSDRGHLTGPPGTFAIDYLYNRRTPLGAIPAGYVFTLDGLPVAALQSIPSTPDALFLQPRRLTMKRSLTTEQRTAIAAAVAVLYLGGSHQEWSVR
jgi:hypothetical protein